MESYHKVFNTIFVTGKYDISFSIGSRIRDGQYVGVRINKMIRCWLTYPIKKV